MTKVDNPIKLESLILAVTGILLYHLSMTSFALTMIFLILPFFSISFYPPHIIKCFLLKIQGFSTFHISVNKPQL